MEKQLYSDINNRHTTQRNPLIENTRENFKI